MPSHDAQEASTTPRKPRFAPPGCYFHVTNRGNDRRKLFFEDVDYWAFVHLLTKAKHRYPIRVHGLCVMPNHFHALVQPLSEGALSAYFQWVLARYACDLRMLTKTTGHGHIFQRRFWSDRIADERHFLSVLRYIEANPVEAELVTTAMNWPWNSLTLRTSNHHGLLDPLPLLLPSEWRVLVDQEQPPDEVDRIERPQARGRPPAASATHEPPD